jgi:tRNA pseudouridine synthase 10
VETHATPALADLEQVRRLSAKGVCDSCLGRFLGTPAKGSSSQARGLEQRLRAGAPATAPRDCHLCQGLSAEYEELAKGALKALDGYEFETMLVGTTVDEAALVRETALLQELGLAPPHPLKQEVNREVGLRVGAALGKEANFEDPDVVALVDTRFNTVRLQVKSAYFRGRYRKLARGIPQTRWPCRACRGRGCKRCNGTGKMYEQSVEEIVAAPLMVALEGQDHALHGAGREDVDARMLGRGRPFVLEIRRPKRRTADLASVMRAIAASSQGHVEVSDLSPCSKESIAALKDADWLKSYRVLVALEKDIKDDQINDACVQLTGSLIDQQTPTRVVHRRADKVRSRRVEKVEFLKKNGLHIELLVKGESGLYIKELVHGDEGRTKPNLSEYLGTPCRVEELDVLEIHDE